MSDLTATIIIALLIVNLLGLLVIGYRVSRQSNDAGDLDRRLTRLEARVDNLPTHRDLLDLRTGIGDVQESMAAISGRTEAMTQMLRTIQEHLLENDR